MKKNAYPIEHCLRLNSSGGQSIKLVCTPEALRELITGFLYNEGLIDRAEELLYLYLSRDMREAFAVLKGKPHFDGTVRPSGLGGEQLGLGIATPPRPLLRRFSLEYIRLCARGMDENAVKYRETGGMHCSALFDNEKCLALFEDIGRHNTLDKLAGHCLFNSLKTEDTLLITTGRISADMVKKAGRLGAAVIASYTTPTREAVETAENANISLISYIARGGTVCTAPDRILL